MYSKKVGKLLITLYLIFFFLIIKCICIQTTRFAKESPLILRSRTFSYKFLMNTLQK